PGDGDGDGDGGPGDGDGDGAPGSIEQSCTDWGNKVGECYGAEYIDPNYMYCMANYQDYLNIYGPACSAAYEAFIVCLSSITCEDLMASPPAGCEQPLMVAQNECQ